MSRRIREFASPTMLIYIVRLARKMQKVEGVDKPAAQDYFPLRSGAADSPKRKKAVQNLNGPEAALARTLSLQSAKEVIDFLSGLINAALNAALQR